MNARNTLFTLLGSVALASVIGLLFTPYNNSSRRKRIADKFNGTMDEAGRTIKKTVSGVKNEIKKMETDIERMVNESG